MPRLLHLSDLHLGGREQGVPPAHERLQSVLDAAENYGPFDAVVVTGDVCDDGSPVDAARAREMLSVMAPLVLAVPGNHDDSGVLHEIFGEPAAGLGTWDVVGVATNVAEQVHGDGHALSSTLAALPDDRATVVLHHHPVHSRSSHPWFTLEHRGAVLDALAHRRAPLLMLSGHTHEAFDLTAGPVRFVGAPSTYYGLSHRGDVWEQSPDVGAVVLELNPNGSSSVTRVHPGRRGRLPGNDAVPLDERA